MTSKDLSWIEIVSFSVIALSGVVVSGVAAMALIDLFGKRRK